MQKVVRISDFCDFLDITLYTSDLIKEKDLRVYFIKKMFRLYTVASCFPQMHYSFSLSSGMTLLNVYISVFG